MNILLVKKNEFQTKELLDFFSNDRIFNTSNINTALAQLETIDFKMALISINSLTDLGLVKYINENYPQTKVILSLAKQIRDAVSIILKGDFTTLDNPLQLKELKKII